MKQYLERILEELPQEDAFICTVSRAIAELIKDGNPSLTRTAKKLGMSPRTLQRQLKTRHVEFKTLVNDTRRHFAQSYLRDRKTSLTEIAFLLGYSEASAFNRAFKRWTGLTPLAYRRKDAHVLEPTEAARRSY